ncbi:hypothetical protein Hanom_Chr05g00387971 [Helianthus anomalus]
MSRMRWQFLWLPRQHELSVTLHDEVVTGCIECQELKSWYHKSVSFRVQYI